MTEQKRRGRPTKAPIEGERASLGLRVTADLKRRLDEAAAASGRSQSQEAELRLERSFERQALLDEVLTLAYGPEITAFITKTGGVVQQVALLRAAQGDTKFTLRRVETELLKELQRVMKEIDK